MAHYKDEKLFCLQNCGLVISWKRLAVVSLASLSLTVSGCSTFVDLPTAPVPKTGDPPTYTGKFELLSKAIEDYEAHRISDVQDVRNREDTAQKALTALTFGALAGGGVAGVYGAHPDTILGFGLVGGGSYAAGQLYLPAQRRSNLTSANEALHCVALTGLEIVSSEDGLVGERVRLANLDSSISSCTTQVDLDARAEYLKASLNLDAFFSLDGTFASQLRRAASGVINALNSQLLQTAVTQQAAAQAALGIQPFATGFVSRVTPPQPAASTESLRVLEAAPCDGVVAIELSEGSKKLDATIRELTNRMAAAKTTCLFEATDLTPLSASPTEISLAKDASLTVEVKGALGIPQWSWEATSANPAPNADQVQVHFVPPDKFRVEGKSNLNAGPAFHARVIDARPAPTPVEIVITPQ